MEYRTVLSCCVSCADCFKACGSHACSLQVSSLILYSGVHSVFVLCPDAGPCKESTQRFVRVHSKESWQILVPYDENHSDRYVVFFFVRYVIAFS